MLGFLEFSYTFFFYENLKKTKKLFPLLVSGVTCGSSLQGPCAGDRSDPSLHARGGSQADLASNPSLCSLLVAGAQGSCVSQEVLWRHFSEQLEHPVMQNPGQAPGRVSADIPSALLSCSEGGRGQLRGIASPERGRFKSWPHL